jgi:hypothetical protein
VILFISFDYSAPMTNTMVRKPEWDYLSGRDYIL